MDESRFESLLWGLDAIRRRAQPKAWRDDFLPTLRLHPLYAAALQCPFSARASARPRGYAGDALLLDFFYREPTISALWERATPLGRDLCDFWVASPAAAAVRARRDLVSASLEKLAARNSGASVLSVACGHLREVLPGSAAMRGAFRRYVALDQDRESLQHVARYHSFPGLEVRKRTVRSLVERDGVTEKFDLIHALGVFDCLRDRFAATLVSRLFDALEPGGSLIVGSFLPSTENIASMEAFQDWVLIYRGREEIEAMASGIDIGRISRQSYVETGCVGVLMVEKA